MLVDDKLAKEKLARELEKLFKQAWLSVEPYPAGQAGSYVRGYQNGETEMLKRLQEDCKAIRNTDLTDCQPQQPMENMSVTQAGNDPSATPSGTPRTDAVHKAACALPFGSFVEVPKGHPPCDPWELARQLERELAQNDATTGKSDE